MIVASDNDRSILAEQVSKYSLSKYFTDYHISETAEAYKPTAKFLANLKKYVPYDTSDGYFVGDALFDVECGKRLGIKSVLADRKTPSQKSDADFVINNLRELLTILRIQ